MDSGPVLIGYDGTAAAERALRETAELLGGREAVGASSVTTSGSASRPSSRASSAARSAPRLVDPSRLVRVAREPDAQVVAVGAHKHGPILGSASRGVVRNASGPALVVREM